MTSLSKTLSDIVNYILSLPEDDPRLMHQSSSLKDSMQKVSLKLKKLARTHEVTTRSINEVPVPSVINLPRIEVPSGINLPRIEVPTFNGDILKWKFFWEQFEATVHSKPQLSDTEKLTYLRDALKDGPAKTIMQGLTQTSESYAEAIECLQERYDRPRLIHMAHV